MVDVWIIPADFPSICSGPLKRPYKASNRPRHVESHSLVLAISAAGLIALGMLAFFFPKVTGWSNHDGDDDDDDDDDGDDDGDQSTPPFAASYDLVGCSIGLPVIESVSLVAGSAIIGPAPLHSPIIRKVVRPCFLLGRVATRGWPGSGLRDRRQ